MLGLSHDFIIQQATGTIKLSLWWLHDLPALLRQHQEFKQQQRLAAQLNLGPNWLAASTTVAAASGSQPQGQGQALGLGLGQEQDPLQGIQFAKLIVEVRGAHQIQWPRLEGPVVEVRSCYVRLEMQESIADTETVPAADEINWGMEEIAHYRSLSLSLCAHYPMCGHCYSFL